MSDCNAVQLSDQMTCSCGNAWGMNDPYPPECKKEPTMLAAAPDHIADTRKMVATAAQGEPEGVRSLLVECERALCCPDPAQRQVTASKILRMLAASTAPAVHGEPAAYISHTSEGDILGWERQFDAPSHTPLYAAPQPAEQQPDVTILLELLTHARCNTCDGSGGFYDNHGQTHQCQWCHDRSRALAAHRKGGEA